MTVAPGREGTASYSYSQTISYAWRPSIKTPLQTCTLIPEGLTAQNSGLIPFDAIASLRLYSLPGLRSIMGPLAQPQRLCIVTSTTGQKIQLGSLHCLGLGRFEDRSNVFDPFITSLVMRARGVDPSVPVLLGMPPATWWSWILTFGALMTALILMILLGLVGLGLEHKIGWMTGGVLMCMFALAVMLGNLVCATWHCRSRPAGEDVMLR